jgi:hypothetical protein
MKQQIMVNGQKYQVTGRKNGTSFVRVDRKTITGYVSLLNGEEVFTARPLGRNVGVIGVGPYLLVKESSDGRNTRVSEGGEGTATGTDRVHE